MNRRTLNLLPRRRHVGYRDVIGLSEIGLNAIALQVIALSETARNGRRAQHAKIDPAATAGRALSANAVAEVDLAVTSRPSPTCCAKVRKYSSRSQRSRSPRKARASLRTSRCRAAFSSTCRRSNTSASRERSNPTASAAPAQADSGNPRRRGRAFGRLYRPHCRESASARRICAKTRAISSAPGSTFAAAAEKTKAPAMVHRDLDLVQRILRDQLSDDFTAIRVDSEEEYLRHRRVHKSHSAAHGQARQALHAREPILEAYGVQAEIDKAIKPRVWLKSGGYLVINQTEALVAIDVNTGKFVGRGRHASGRHDHAHQHGGG